MNSQRVYYFDYLRIFAIFAVIILHVAAQNWENTNVNSFEWQVFNFYDSVVRWGVPVFVMISGSLFIGKKHRIKKLYQKYILRIIIAFLTWSILYALWNNIVINNNLSIKTLINEILIGHYHLWFMFMIVGLYIIVPFLNKIVEDRKIAWYFVITSFVFAFILPQLSEIIGLKFSGISGIIDEITSKLHLHMVLGYSGYFVLGFLLQNTEIKKKYRIIIYVFGILGLIFTISSTSILSLFWQSPAKMFYGNLTVNVLLVAMAVFVFAKTNLNKPIPSLRKQQMLLFFSKCTFGVYLIHPFFIELIKKYFNITSLTINPIFAVPILSVIVFLLSLLVSALLNLIPIVKNWMV